jgi:hypothetical protein
MGEMTGDSLRGYRLAGGDVLLDDGCKHQPLPRTEARIRHLPHSPSGPADEGFPDTYETI